MNRNGLLNFAVCLLLQSSFIVCDAQFDTKAIYVDKFNKRGLVNEHVWNIDTWHSDKELQTYTNSKTNLFVRNGKLHIKANYSDSTCFSAKITTQAKFAFHYGKIEIKAKCPIGAGIWPAIWMLREDHGYKFPLAEIDILEYVDCWKSKSYQSNLHIVTKEKGQQEKRKQFSKLANFNVAKWHVYSLEWYRDKIVFLCDNVIVNEVNKSECTHWPFEVPYYLILNVAYGGWGGECGLDNTIFPCEMQVDWIRYYRLKE